MAYCLHGMVRLSGLWVFFSWNADHMNAGFIWCCFPCRKQGFRNLILGQKTSYFLPELVNLCQDKFFFSFLIFKRLNFPLPYIFIFFFTLSMPGTGMDRTLRIFILQCANFYSFHFVVVEKEFLKILTTVSRTFRVYINILTL